MPHIKSSRSGFKYARMDDACGHCVLATPLVLLFALLVYPPLASAFH